LLAREIKAIKQALKAVKKVNVNYSIYIISYYVKLILEECLEKKG